MEDLSTYQEIQPSIRHCLDRKTYELYKQMEERFLDASNNLKALGKQIQCHHSFLLREILEIEKGKKEDCRSEKKRNERRQRKKRISSDFSPPPHTSISRPDLTSGLESEKKKTYSISSEKERKENPQKALTTTATPPRDMTVSEHVSPDMLMYSGSRKRKARNPKYREKLNKRSTTALKSDGKEKDLGAESQTTQALPIKNLEEERKVKNITLQSPGRGADEVTSTDSHSKQTVPMGLCQLSLPDLLTTKRRLLIAACQNFSLCIEKLPPNLVKSLYASKKYDIPSHDMESSSDDSWDKRIVSVSLAQRRKRRERSTSESSGISMEIPLQNDEKSLIAGKTRARKAKLLIYSSDEETSVMETPQKKPKMSVADKLGLVSCNTKLFPSPSSPTRKRPIKRRLTMSSSSETEKAPALNGFVDSLTPPKRNTRSKKNRLSDKHGGVGNLVNKSQIKLNSETGQSSLENSSTLQPVKPVSKTSQSSLDTTSTLDSSPLGGKSWWPPHQMKKDKEGAESSQRFVTILDDASEKSIEKAHIPRKFYMSSLDSRKETAASILDSVTRSKQSKPDSKTGCSSLPDSSLSPSPELPLSIKSSTPLKTGYLSDKAVSQSPVLSKAPHLGSSSLKRRSTRIALLKSLSDSEAVSMEARADPYPLRNRSPKQPLKKSAVSSLKDFTSSPQMGSTVSVDVGKSVDKEVQTMIQTTQHSSKQNQSHVSHPGSSPSPENIAGTGTANRTSTQRRQALSNHTTTRGLISVSNKQNKQTITSTNKKSKKRPSLPSQAKVNKELKEGDSLSLEGGSEGVSVKSSEDHLYSPSTDHTTSSSLVSHSHKPLDAASDLSPESDRLPQVPQNEARTCRKRSGRKKRTITSTNKKSKKRPSLRSQAKVNKELKEGDSLSLEGGSEGVSVKLSEDHLYSPSTDHTTSSSLVSHSHKPLDAANDLHVPPESDRLPQVPQNEARTRRKRSGRKKRTITSTNKRSRKRPSLPSQAKVNKELKEGDSLSLEGGSEGVSVKLSEDHLYSPSTDHTTSSSLVSHSHKPLDAASDLPPESDHLPQVPQNEARTHKKRSSRKRTIGLPPPPPVQPSKSPTSLKEDEAVLTQQLDRTLLPGNTSIMSLRGQKQLGNRPSYLTSRLSSLEESRVEKSILGGRKRLVSSQLSTSSMLMGAEDNSWERPRRRRTQLMKVNTRYFTTPKLKSQELKKQ